MTPRIIGINSVCWGIWFPAEVLLHVGDLQVQERSIRMNKRAG